MQGKGSDKAYGQEWFAEKTGKGKGNSLTGTTTGASVNIGAVFQGPVVGSTVPISQSSSQQAAAPVPQGVLSDGVSDVSINFAKSSVVARHLTVHRKKEKPSIPKWKTVNPPPKKPQTSGKINPPLSLNTLHHIPRAPPQAPPLPSPPSGAKCSPPTNGLSPAVV